tara:strand:+ start:59 stop:409 length:351 start_codon:yes stop_codon:yes gene_type:complete
MAIPSGSGTEVLKVNRFQGINATNTIVLQGVADHIYTVLSIIFVNTDSSAREIYMRMYDGTGTSNEHYILQAQSVPTNGTFVFNDKMVISGAYNLRVSCANGDMDVTVSYIDQDWS